MADREQAVDHVEAFGAFRPVDAGEFHHLFEQEARIVAQHGHQRDQTVAAGMGDQLVLLPGDGGDAREGGHRVGEQLHRGGSGRGGAGVGVLSHGGWSRCGGFFSAIA